MKAGGLCDVADEQSSSASTGAIYVSCVDFGGVPIGDISNGIGTKWAPYGAFSMWYDAIAAAPIVILNGDPQSPALYTQTPNAVLGHQQTISAASPFGAILAADSGSAAVRIAPANGETPTLREVIIDPSVNTQEPGVRCVELTTQAVPYGFRGIGCKFRNFASSGHAIVNMNADLRCSVSLKDCEIRGGDVRGGLYIDSMSAGGVELTDCNIFLAAMNHEGRGRGLMLCAVGTEVAGKYVRSGLSIAMKSTSSERGIVLGIRFVNIKGAIIDGGTQRGTVHKITANPGNIQAAVTGIVTNRGYNSPELPIDNSVIRNLEIYNGTNGGICVQIGDDGSDRTKANHLLIENCSVHGSANFQAGGGHCVFMCCTTDSIIQHVEAYHGAIGLINKRSTRGVIQDCEVRDMTASYLRAKGAEDFVFRRIVAKAGVGFKGTMLSVGPDVDDPVPLHSNGICKDVHFIIDGAETIVLVRVEPGSHVAITNCYFELRRGSLSRYMFQVDGEMFDSFAKFSLAFPGNRANFS